MSGPRSSMLRKSLAAATAALKSWQADRLIPPKKPDGIGGSFLNHILSTAIMYME